MHQLRLLPHLGVFLADSHTGDHAAQVHQSSVQHRLLPEPLHLLALGRHRDGVRGDAGLHRGATENLAVDPDSGDQETEED